MSKVSFISSVYGNFQDNWYTDNYNELIRTLLKQTRFSVDKINLGVTNGVVIENNFKGNFQDINCAVVESDIYGTHLYKLIKKVFIRRDLYRVTMVKDMVSSKFRNILESKVLVSRLGLDRKVFDPILFQKEVVELSEVKTGHNLLNELPNVKSYGYLLIWARGSLDGTLKWQSTVRGISDYDAKVEFLSDLPFYNKKERIRFNKSGRYTVSANDNPNIVGRLVTYNASTNGGEQYNSVANAGVGDFIAVAYSDGSLKDNMRTFMQAYEPYSDYGNISEYIGRVVLEEDTGIYYEIGYKNTVRTDVKTLSDANIKFLLGTDVYSGSQAANSFGMWEEVLELTYTPIREIPVVDHTLSIYADAIDQPFQLTYIPIIEGAKYSYDGMDYECSKTIVESMLYDLLAKYGGENGKLLDVQLIPYTPVDGMMRRYNTVENRFYVEFDAMKDVIEMSAGMTPYVIPMYEVLYCSYSTTIRREIDVTDYKVEQKKRYILTSPSGASTYEFSVAKNRGLDGFICDIDLRPYASFFRVQPVYGALYGGNFKDTRGLIWQEDTSLTKVTEAWETYKRQNLNYMASFNAEQNFKRSQLAIDQEANWGNYGFDAGKRLIEATVEATAFAAEAVANDVWGGVKGAVSGGVGAGAIMGGAVITEAIEAGQLAYNNQMDSKKLNAEIDYARQQFNYQLGNIKAIPENLEKVNGVFNTNNFVPYLQEFSPTEAEIRYLNTYLDLYGVNVGMMVDLSEKQFNYLQGTIVKYEGIITNEEYQELHAQITRGVRKYEVS